MRGRKSSRWGQVCCGILAGVGGLPAAAWACAVCWGGDDGLAHGMHVSILFLMSMPFFIAGSIFGVIYMAHLRAQGQRWPSFLSKGMSRSRRRTHCE
jgi:hypothetical protein